MAPSSPAAWLKITLIAPDEDQERLMADLHELGFYAFEQQEGRIATYIAEKVFEDVVQREFSRVLKNYSSVRQLTEEWLVEENWNRKWEESIQPMEIGPFLIRPTWASVPDGEERMEILIDPKMAFGTGSHATTRLMLEALSGLNLPGKRVLDAGTGTGILAIAALKGGAEQVFAFDLDPWSIDNARENAELNGVAGKLEIRQGSEETIPKGATYDLILANINRNALFNLLEAFMEHLSEEGEMVLSGLLLQDREVMINAAASAGFRLTGEESLPDWPGGLVPDSEKPTEGFAQIGHTAPSDTWLRLHFRRDI
ncbi:MAG: 50S ribosomal protein L11 methyltransferase [Balneolaceae bacterium]